MNMTELLPKTFDSPDAFIKTEYFYLQDTAYDFMEKTR